MHGHGEIVRAHEVSARGMVNLCRGIVCAHEVSARGMTVRSHGVVNLCEGIARAHEVTARGMTVRSNGVNLCEGPARDEINARWVMAFAHGVRVRAE